MKRWRQVLRMRGQMKITQFSSHQRNKSELIMKSQTLFKLDTQVKECKEVVQANIKIIEGKYTDALSIEEEVLVEVMGPGNQMVYLLHSVNNVLSPARICPNQSTACHP